MNLNRDVIRLILLEVKLFDIVSCIISQRYLNILIEGYFISMYAEKNRQTEFNDLLKVLSSTSAKWIYKIVWEILQLNMENPKYINSEYDYLYLGINGKYDNYGNSALILASIKGHTGIVRLLLFAGANVHDKDDNDGTALIWASIHGYIEIVRILLASGANVHNKDKYYYTAIMSATYNGHVEIVEMLLLASANIHDQDNNCRTAIIWASSNGYIEIVKTLLDAGANLNDKDMYGRTALDYASRNGHTETVELLRSYDEKN